MNKKRRVFIEESDTKIGRIASVSLLPVEGCRHRAPCRDGRCYAMKLCSLKPIVREAWADNLRMANLKLDAFHHQILEYIRKHQPPYFRWHVGGDILNFDYFWVMCMIAMANPKTTFLCSTKQYDVVERVTCHPWNLKVILSVWPRHPFTNAQNLPLAFMQDGTETRVPSYAEECSGNCIDCDICWKLHRGQAVYFYKHGEEKESRERKKRLDEERAYRATETEKAAEGTAPPATAWETEPPDREISRDERFIAYANDTVMDTKTKLMWASKDNGYDIDWEHARSYCTNFRGGGYGDWRMPTQDELAGLRDFRKPRWLATRFYLPIHVATKLIDITGSTVWANEVKDNIATCFDFSVPEFRIAKGPGWQRLSAGGFTRALPVRSGG